MSSGPRFLLAARQCEIAELEQLASTADLLALVGRFIHALQRERGLSNIFISSHGSRCAGQRIEQVAECQRLEDRVRTRFEDLRTDSGRVRNGARLFSRIALLVHGLDDLPHLRQRIGAQAITAVDATTDFSQLVAGLLAVVFEAADTASDPQVSRALLAMFNFMQGKEFAGQERALGSRLFAAGRIEADDRQQWQHLLDSQQACFQTFADFCGPQPAGPHPGGDDPGVLAEVERLRRVALGGRACSLQPHLLEPWYDACTRRLDAMREVEERLALHLGELCGQRIAQARAELRDQSAMLESLAAQARAAGATGAAPYGPQLERSVLEMVQEQSQRLQAMGDELDSLRATLHERKVVERAKGVLMAHRQMTEGEAYKALRQLAMNQNRRLVEVAQNLLSVAEVLPGSSR
ncbi:MAG TPA: nitrate- and nitrite sensing domain-containing protein [Ramlibacter sp.]|nr:nitrate- and nitrite sensing domain-containing protein [Ramlibacter sp.]